jgi:hypothetical protein
MISCLIETPFQSEFEGLKFYVYNAEIEKFNGIMEDSFSHKSPFVRTISDTNFHFYLPSRRELVGKLFFLLRSRDDICKAGVWLEIQLRAHGIADSDAEVFYKVAKFWFNWLENYCKEYPITDENGNAFIVPDFPYSMESLLIDFAHHQHIPHI